MTSFSRIRPILARHRRDIATIAIIGLVVVGVLALTHPWWDELIAVLRNTNPFLFFGIACLLPLGGFSITMIYVVAGARFGAWGGIVLMAGATVFHLVGTHLIARSVLRGPLDRLMRRRGYRLPDAARECSWSFALLGALVPGPPYFVRNYLLALSGVPWPVYFAVCWPVYVARSCAAVVVGDWGVDITVTRAVVIVGILLLQVVVCVLLVRHLYRVHKGRMAGRGASRTGSLQPLQAASRSTSG